MGHIDKDEAVATCREEGGTLPLPKNDEEKEDFRTLGGLIDATDFDGDGVWHDSYGNVVTYFAPFKQPENPDNYDSYPYLIAVLEYNSNSGEWEVVWSLAPGIGRPNVFCQIPIASSEPSVEGENFSFLVI